MVIYGKREVDIMDEIKMLVVDKDFDFKSRFIHYVINSCRNITVQTMEYKEISDMNKHLTYDLISSSQLIITGIEYLEKIKDMIVDNKVPIICLSDNINENADIAEKKIFYIYVFAF